MQLIKTLCSRRCDDDIGVSSMAGSARFPPLPRAVVAALTSFFITADVKNSLPTGTCNYHGLLPSRPVRTLFITIWLPAIAPLKKMAYRRACCPAFINGHIEAKPELREGMATLLGVTGERLFGSCAPNGDCGAGLSRQDKSQEIGPSVLEGAQSRGREKCSVHLVDRPRSLVVFQIGAV